MRTSRMKNNGDGGFTQVARRSTYAQESEKGSSAYWAQSGTPHAQQIWWESQSSQTGTNAKSSYKGGVPVP